MYEHIVTHIISKFKTTTWVARVSNMEVSSETWQEEERERPKYYQENKSENRFCPEIYIRTVLL